MLAPFSWSLELVLFLQQWSPHPWLDSTIIAITLLGDPKIVFLYLAPLVYWSMSTAKQRRSIAIEMILGLVASDYLNALLKFPLAGDRPYWHDDRVKEFWLTCESGFGMPSGHCMVSACTGMILLHRVPRRWVRWARLGGVVFLLALMASRLYVGAHFPGQVVAGAVVGLALGSLIVRSDLASRLSERLSALRSRCASSRLFLLRTLAAGVLASLALLALASLELTILSILPGAPDPLHSIVLAHEGCEATRATATAAAATAAAIASSTTSPSSAANDLAEQQQFQLERSPLIGVVRDAGVVVGAALALAMIFTFSVIDGPVDSTTPTTRGSNSGSGSDSPGASNMEEAVPLNPSSRNSNQSGGVNARAPSPPLLAQSPSRSLRSLVFRNVFGLAESSLLRELLARMFLLAPFPALSRAAPLGFVYAKNYIVFAAITLNYLVVVPIILGGIERAMEKPTRSMTRLERVWATLFRIKPAATLAVAR